MMIKQYRKTIVLIIVSLACLIVYLLINSKQLDRPTDIHEKQELALKKLVEQPIKPGKPLEEDALYSTPEFPDRLNFSPSLEGTEIDGKLEADKSGNLKLDLTIRDFFDYFLLATDDVGPELAIDEIVRYANDYLPEPANTQAIELLKNYLRYKKTELELQQVPIDKEQLTQKHTIDLISENFNSLKERRKELFDSETEKALFTLEDSYAEYTLESLKLRADENLTSEEKALKLNELKQNLTKQLASSEQSHEEVQEKQKEVEGLVNSTIDDSQLHNQLTENGYSYQKADDIVSHRQNKKYFDKQYWAYLKAKKTLDETAETKVNVKQLRERFFITQEDQTKAALLDLDKR